RARRSRRTHRRSGRPRRDRVPRRRDGRGLAATMTLPVRCPPKRDVSTAGRGAFGPAPERGRARSARPPATAGESGFGTSQSRKDVFVAGALGRSSAMSDVPMGSGMKLSAAHTAAYARPSGEPTAPVGYGARRKREKYQAIGILAAPNQRRRSNVKYGSMTARSEDGV